MLNGDDFVKAVQRIAVNAMNAEKPSNGVFGKVISASPLKIQVEQKLILTSAQLVLSRNVTDYEVEMTVDHLTENESGGSGEESFSEHCHEYKGKKKFLVHNKLKSGEEVILCQVAGGQKYIVLDRIGKG